MQGLHKSNITSLAASILVCLYALASPAAVEKLPSGPPVGTIAPGFKVKNAVTGEEVPLSSQQGKVVVMTFWAAWCPSCRQELPVLERIQEIVGKDHLTVNYRENPDSWGRLKKAAAQWKITLVDDQSGWIARNYKVSLTDEVDI
jgi:thiol-disulfide isomerase/thioredoxin